MPVIRLLLAPALTCAALGLMLAQAAQAAGAVAQPAFHMLPVLLDEPSTIDAGGTNISAHQAPRRVQIDSALADVPTARLTPRVLAGLQRARALSAAPQAAARPFASAVYTPAQIRAAYGLPELPAAGASLPAAIAASLGAGQTIYLIDADDDPSAFADLNTFSNRFGVPTCSSLRIGAAPLAAAGTGGCTFSVVYTDGSGQIKSAAPPYDEGWASEISLDVQWAHAIAPLARLVLIEVASGATTDLAGGVALANRLGSGIVSMSFGAVEGSWMNALESDFTVAGMSYLAAAGDGGAGVAWPAASPHVLAVGGTSLAWSGSGTRNEAVWSDTGGGVSAYYALPSWQAGVSLAGGGAPVRRAVTDVAFNGDPNTGQYVAVTPPNAGATQWGVYGGTSLSTPQWAGLIAVANALRASAQHAALGDVHAALYQTIARVPGNYAAAFDDVVSGGDGSCQDCAATVGYDLPSGLGTPNAQSLWTQLAGVSASPAVVAPTPPTVPGGTFTVRAKKAWSQALGIGVPSGLTATYSLSGAPSGLGVSTAGALQWASPAVGKYVFTVTARTSAGASASGSYTLWVDSGQPPKLPAASFTAQASAAFSTVIQASDPDGFALSYALNIAPAGVTLSSTGTLSWSKPVKGVYPIRITVTDAVGQSTTTNDTLTVNAVTASNVRTPSLLR